MYWDVIEIKPKSFLRLFVRFADGTKGNVCFLPEHLTGVFERLKDPEYFNKVFVSEGVVTWPDELDLAPDAMYGAIKKNGEWILA